MDEFRRDLEDNLSAMGTARTELLERVRALSPDEIERARRGGWSIREVLRHLIDSEVAYAKVAGFLRGNPPDLPNTVDEDVASGAAAADALERVRETLLSLLDGVDERTFYELRALGREQYSIVSVLENVTNHDHEHLEQIARTLEPH